MVCQTSVIHETQKVPSSQTHSYKNLPYTESTPFQNKSLKPFFVLVRVNLAVTYKQIFPGWLHTNTSKIQENFKRISIEASEHRDAYISPPICFNQLNFGLHLVLFKIYTSLHTTLSRADPENYDRGGRDTWPLYRYFLLSWEFYKNNTKFQRKKGVAAPLSALP